MGGSQGEIRIGLTISGAIALGAYEGGALAALLCAAQAVNERQRDAMRIDAIAGASAGSITGLLAARTLVRGMDPIDAMYGAWVVMPQLEDLADGCASPLSVERSRAEAEKLLRADEEPKRSQSTPIRMNMALGCLRGLDYSISRIVGPPISASTYLDWGERTVRRASNIDWYLKENGPLDEALASGAHAAAFPPYGLDRRRFRKQYESNGIENFPDSRYLWYTDGGTIDNQPLGRALDLTQEIDEDDPVGDAYRLHLLITPDPAHPGGPEPDVWSTPGTGPSWLKSGLRALKLVRTQQLYDDLRRVEKTNSRISWLRLVERELLAIMEGRTGDPVGALKAVTKTIHKQRRQLDKRKDFRQAAAAEQESPLVKALRGALDAATGLSKKSDVAVAVVSPLVLPEVKDGTHTPRDVLAGAFLGHFGGFLDQHLRDHDFALGYRSMLLWMEGDSGLKRHFLDAGLSSIAVTGAKARWNEWNPDRSLDDDDNLGGTTFKKLSFRKKLKLYRVALRSGWIAFNQVRHLRGSD